jgi:thymidine phosphorylase
MVGIGTRHGVETVALITPMDQPLGHEVGNANEIRESVDVLRGMGPEDVTELTLAFGEVMLELAGIEGGRDRLEEAIDTGKAMQKLIDVTIAHGGDPAVLHDTSLLAVAPMEAAIAAPADGYVTVCDALTIGMGATLLGAGRTKKKDVVDPGVGLTIHAKIGDKVSTGDPLATVRYTEEDRWQSQRDYLASAWVIGPSPGVSRPLILEKVSADSVDR